MLLNENRVVLKPVAMVNELPSPFDNLGKMVAVGFGATFQLFISNGEEWLEIPLETL